MKPIRPTSRPFRGLSRRDVLWTAGGGFAAGLLSPVLVGLAVQQSRGESAPSMHGHTGARNIGVPRAPYQKGAPLLQADVRRSANGELRTTLQVRYAYKDMGGYRLHLRSYEGTIPGPTFASEAGDTLRIRLINDLPPNPDPVPVDMMLPHHFNTTNFHFHGLHVSPERHLRQHLSIDGARAELRHRDRHSSRSYQGHLLVPSAPSRQRRHPDHRRHGGGADHRGRLRRYPRNLRRRGSCAHAERGAVRLPRHDRDLRHRLA